MFHRGLVESKLKEVALRWRKRLLWQGLRVWVGVVEGERRVRVSRQYGVSVVAGVLRRLSKKALYSGWVKWVEYVRWSADTRFRAVTPMSLVVGRVQRRDLLRGFMAWRGAAAVRRVEVAAAGGDRRSRLHRSGGL